MFNALNRFMSRLDGGDTPQQRRQQEGGSYGFQVLRNINLELPIEPWFDFIVGINGRPIENSDPALFAQEVRNCAGGTVTLGLWNAKVGDSSLDGASSHAMGPANMLFVTIKGQRTKELHAPVPLDTGSLGLSLQYTPIAIAANIWHVLDVAANSPADQAALLPYSDYILGSPEGALHGEGALGELVEDFISRPLRLYVYNNEYNVTREVTIQPSRDWGGEGALGCVLGYGALHRLPAPLSEPVSAPGETMFDGEPNEKAGPALFSPVEAAPPGGGDYLIPAQMVGSAPVSAPPRGGKKKEKHGHNANPLMDDYFKEEEQKSRELDGTPKAATGSLPPPPKTGALPPPPKAGGPPKAEPAAAKSEDESE